MKRRHLKIAITSPKYLPYGRRGAERYLHDLSNFLSSRGHEVTIITSKPGKPKIQRRGNTSIIYHGYLQHPLLLRDTRLNFRKFALNCFTSLLTGKYDIAHSVMYPDGYALSINRIIKGTRYVFQVINSPDLITGGQPTVRWMIKSLLKEELGHESDVISIPVDGSFFRPISTRDMDHPRILFAGSLNDRRKRVDLLIEAFNILIRKIPKAILQMSGPVDPIVREELVSRIDRNAIDSVYILGPGKFADMPKLYSEASVTVLPSMDEALGMVLIESLACGTPVVGTNAGGIPEIISDPRIGALFEPNDRNLSANAENLCETISRTLDISKDPKTARRCREHAKRYSWELIGPQIEQLYFAVLDGK